MTLLRPIIDQFGTYFYNASKVSYPNLLKNIKNSDGYKDLCYNFDSRFTSIPAK